MNVLAKFFDDFFTHGFEKYGKFYSRYRGFVVERDDPLHLGRLKLLIPEIAGRSVIPVWAFPVNVFSGDNYGSQIIPQINDMVWVEFEKGNPRAPIWSLGHYGENDTRAEELKDYDNYYFKTPAGHTIELDDTNSIIRITTVGTVEIFKDGEELQPAVLGNTLQERLEELLDLLLKAKTNTTMGPQPLFNILIELQTLKDSIPDIKSKNLTVTEGV